MLPQQRGGEYLHRGIGEHHGASQRGEVAPFWMRHLHHHAPASQGLVLDQLLGAHDGATGNILLVHRCENLPLAAGLGPFLDQAEAPFQLVDPCLGRGEFGVLDQLGLANQVHQRRPARGLDDHVDIIVLAAGRAFQGGAGLSPARGVGRAGHEIAELLGGVFGQGAVGQPLLVAQLDPAQVEHRILHGHLHPLSPAGFFALEQGGQDAGHAVYSRARIADLGAGGQGHAVLEAGRAHGAAHGLGDGFIRLEVHVGPFSESLDGGVNQPGIELLDAFPGETLAVQHAGGEVLHHHVAELDQPGENLLALFGFQIEGDAALVAIEHGEIQAVHIRNVPQLRAGDVSPARQFNLDHIRAQVAQQLRRRWPGLDVRHIQNFNSFQSLAHDFLVPSTIVLGGAGSPPPQCR